MRHAKGGKGVEEPAGRWLVGGQARGNGTSKPADAVLGEGMVEDGKRGAKPWRERRREEVPEKGMTPEETSWKRKLHFWPRTTVDCNEDMK